MPLRGTFLNSPALLVVDDYHILFSSASISLDLGGIFGAGNHPDGRKRFNIFDKNY
jgi:hypothetical protein